ncbi:MAG: hypothetical protein LBQ20_10350 [Rhodanobacter sp.]|nr:hypothetical protein [Rhodanobacter sp.]
MSIRRTLLIAFLGVGLVSAILLASLAFVKARQALRLEIERNMSVEAATVAAEVDKMMFERLQNAAVWSHLNIMQDLQVHDVDKRLSRFLSDLKSGYGEVYSSLACTDAQGTVIASSDPAAVGGHEETGTPWLKTNLSGTVLELKLDRADHSVKVFIDVPIASAFAEQRLGKLRLSLDWNEMESVLDRTGSEDGRTLALLDESGRVIAASRTLRERGLLLSDALAEWRAFAGRIGSHSGQPVVDTEVIIGGAHSKGYAQFSGFNWTALVVQPTDRALAPVHRMAMIFFALLGLIAALTFVVGTWISHTIALPIVALTRFARSYMRDKVLQAPPTGGKGEIGELTEAFVRMVHDINVSQQRLVRASKLAVVGEMSSIIAHEIRTPLGIVRSSAQVLQRESGISAEGHELVGFIQSETERLNRLVSAMLDTARPRTPTFVETDMHEVIQRSIAMLAGQAEHKRVRVSTHLHAVAPIIACDEDQMTQVILNLLMNGLQILHQGGAIDVTTHDDRANLFIEIADDGPGIDPAERSRVFEAFFFKREGGIGLGLAIVQQIVNAHGGDIEADDSLLGGALFRLRLPRNTLEMA